MDLFRVIETGAWMAGAVVTYELTRSFVLGRLRRRLERAGERYVSDRNIRLDRYKFAGRGYVKTELLDDPGIRRAIEDHATTTGKPAAKVWRDVDDWIDEIVPAFNTLAYYRFGYAIARTALHFIFEVLVDDHSLRRARAKVPEGAAVVYVFNHRSNADFVLASYALASQIALSYAVGEWARVWPLDVLFRKFGAYFVRRGFKNPLYHLVLARYVQLIVKRGVTQGVFPEGGLSRDGRLREPKLGIVDAIAQLKADPAFGKDVVFVPVGINYDRVLEDRSLIAEAKGGAALGKDTIASRIATLGSILRRVPTTFFSNSVAAALGRTGRYGYAAVTFGDPVSLSSWLSAQGEDVFAFPLEERRRKIRGFADLLMSQIARLVPATPATLVADVLARGGEERIGEQPLRIRLEERIAEIRAGGRPLAQGREFAPIHAGWTRLADAGDRRAELLEEERAMVAAEESELTVRLGLDFLRRRKAIRMTGEPGERTITITDRALVEYYARSLAGRVGAPR